MTIIPLQKFPVARAASPGNLRDAVADLTGYDHQVLANSRTGYNQPGTVNGMRLDDLSLVFVAYATSVSVLAPPTEDRVVFVIPLGPMTVEVDGRRETFTTPFALSAAADSIMYPDALAGALVGSIGVAELTELLREIFGHDRDFIIDLSERKPIRLGASTTLSRLWTSYAMNPHDIAPASMESPECAGLRAQVHKDDLVDALLVSLAQNTNYRPEEASLWQSAPAYLVHATRYIQKNIGQPISIAEVSETTGIGARQLQLSFKSHLGCTAQEYLKAARLDRAHELLTSADAAGPLSIAEVSAAVGIAHQGRFSRYFADRFGVLPSQLLSANPASA